VVKTNRDLEATREYHEGTKHSFQSVHSSRHFLDFENQPLPFKIYPGLEPIPLPRELEPSGVSALDALAASPAEAEREHLPDLKLLARLLYYSAGITKRIRYPHGEMLFRAASCTGALYHIDLYLVCGDLPDLEAGVYHFGAHDFAFRQLRRGDFRGELVRATADESAVASAPAILICSSTFLRNSWKYQARAYRHCFWDSGTILANLLAMTAAQRVPARVVCGFVDERVNRLLGLEPRREAALALASLGRNSPIGQTPEVEPLALETTPLSKSEVDYPAIRVMHEASSLTEEAQVAAWRGAGSMAALAPPAGRLFPLQPLDDREAPHEGGFRDKAGELGLEQALPADASANVFFLRDLAPILERFGNRGYRLAQLEAAIKGGRLYLASYALGLGATGLTFYDDDVTDFFSPHAYGKSTMFLMALGHPARRMPG
jgi:SagB-type dehydrogenase family enzyme